MKITNYIPVILCSIALCGCSDAAKTVGFGTDSDAIEAPATGGTHTVRVSAEKEWVATTDEPWITVSPANGRGTTECRVLIDSALTDQPRRGVIRIMEQNTWVKEIAVSQKASTTSSASTTRRSPSPTTRRTACATSTSR